MSNPFNSFENDFTKLNDFAAPISLDRLIKEVAGKIVYIYSASCGEKGREIGKGTPTTKSNHHKNGGFFTSLAVCMQKLLKIHNNKTHTHTLRIKTHEKAHNYMVYVSDETHTLS